VTQQDDEHSRRNDPIVQAQRVVLDLLLEKYPAQYSMEELKLVIRSKRVKDGDVEDAVRELLAHGLVHQQGDGHFYWLARPVCHITDIEWSPFSV
jgi:hypothetical protein